MSRITPFDTIESAQDFVNLLAQEIAQAKQEVEFDLNREADGIPTRHFDALRIAVYNLDRLEKHMASSRRILNDLRSLRRLLFAEREFHRVRSLGESLQPAHKAQTTPDIVAAIPAPKSVGTLPMVAGTARPGSPRIVAA